MADDGVALGQPDVRPAFRGVAPAPHEMFSSQRPFAPINAPDRGNRGADNRAFRTGVSSRATTTIRRNTPTCFGRTSTRFLRAHCTNERAVLRLKDLVAKIGIRFG
jgi:hypothetical protein